MDHPEASALLTDFADGGLEAGRRSAVEAHVARCDECREWLAISRFLADSLGRQAAREPWSQAAGGHVSSGELAAFALTPEDLSKDDRDRCTRHVAACAQCQGEADLVRSAVIEARQAPGARESTVMPFSRPSSKSRNRLGLAVRTALAAGLFVAVGAWIIGGVVRTPDDQVLSGEVFEGERTVTARRSLVVDDTEVMAGARVVFEASERVAFGDGFSIGPGARLTVSTLQDNNSDSAS